jgi:hypothetical protein
MDYNVNLVITRKAKHTFATIQRAAQLTSTPMAEIAEAIDKNGIWENGTWHISVQRVVDFRNHPDHKA